jgi:hypothetical protein
LNSNFVMKWLASFFLAAAAAAAQPTNRQVWLDPLQVVRLPVSQERLTTVRFPSPISDLEGAFISANAEPPARFQVSFRPGSEWFSLRALTTNVSATLAVGWNGNVYHLECVDSPVSSPGVFFNEKSAAPIPTVPPPSIPQPTTTRTTSEDRLCDILEIAQSYANLQKLKSPLRLRDVKRQVLRRHFAHPDCDILLSQIFDFNADDTLVFQITILNRTAWPLYYTPHSLAVKVGKYHCASSVFSADGLVPARASSTIYFGITGGVRGSPAGLSPDNEFEVVLDRAGSSAFSHQTRSNLKPAYVTPYR